MASIVKTLLSGFSAHWSTHIAAITLSTLAGGMTMPLSPKLKPPLLKLSPQLLHPMPPVRCSNQPAPLVLPQASL